LKVVVSPVLAACDLACLSFGRAQRLFALAAESEKSHPKESLPAIAQASVMSGSLAREIQVSATGARPGTSPANRALFNEDTSSVLISEKGGVIRLSAAVVLGQLVFLTNNESHREVVAQVIRVRSFRPTSCYVEVEFTEPAPGFWGVDFKAEAAQAPKDPKQRETIAAVRAAKPANAESRPRASTPSMEEVSALKDEVATLREQLRLLQSKSAPADPPKVPAVPAAHTSPPPGLDFSPVDAPELAASGTSTETSHAAKVPTFEFMTNSATQGPSAPVVASSAPPATSIKPEPPASPGIEPQLPARASSLPIDKEPPPGPSQFYVSQPPNSVEHSVATDVSSPLNSKLSAPLPRINFPRVASSVSKKGVKARGSFTPSIQNLFRRVVVPVATLVVFGGVIAWRAPMILSSFTGKGAPTASAAGKTAATSVPNSASSSASVLPSDSQKLAAVPGSAALPTGLTPPSATVAATPSDKIGVAVISPDASDRTGDRFLDASIVTKTAGRRARGPKINPKQVTFSDLSPVATDDPGVIPPQLVKSVKAVAPPEALRRFFTGNVLVEAIVDATGRVTVANAVAGPPSLYQAAIDTLKEYRFAPAKRNGKAIPAHIELTINFWFEP
jgi:hypothetical protein